MSSPFDNLPVEVIQAIFLSCWQAQNNCNILPPSPYTVQYVLPQVCSRWRSIALTTPQLWNHFILSMDNDHEAKHALRLASVWLDRAGNSLVTLQVWADLPHNSPSIHEFHRLIFSHKFKCLTGSLLLYWIPLHDRSYEASFASLDSLYIDEFPVSLPLAWYLEVDDHCRLPSLRYLDIDLGGPWQDSLHVIPWHQLSKLALHRVAEISTIIEIMRKCKALLECNLRLTRSCSHAASVLPPTFTLHNLWNLELSSPSPIAHLTGFLSSFNVPNLTSLYLLTKAPHVTNARGIDWLPSQLPSHIGALFKQLKKFRYSSFTWPTVLDIRVALVHLPALHELRLGGTVLLDYDTAEQISIGELGRHIHTLSFDYCSCTRRLLDMIEKRQTNAERDKERNLTSFILVAFGCSVTSGDGYKDRVEQIERQHNVRIEMDASFAKTDDDFGEED